MESSKINMTAQPLVLAPRDVLKEWLDYNGHMNVAYYVLAFDEALEDVWIALGMGEEYLKAENKTCFTLEIHLCYLHEVREGDPLRITFQLLDVDEKRVHFIMQMFHAEQNYLVATCEQVAIHVDLARRRASPYPDKIYKNVKALYESHKNLKPPAQTGKNINIKPKK